MPCIPISHALARSSSGGSSERPRALAATSTAFGARRWQHPYHEHAAQHIGTLSNGIEIGIYEAITTVAVLAAVALRCLAPSQNSSVFLMNATSQGTSTTRSMEGVYAQSQ